MREPPALRPASHRTIAALQVLLAVAVLIPALFFAAAAWQSRAQVLRAAAAAVESTAAMLEEHALQVMAAHAPRGVREPRLDAALFDRTDAMRTALQGLDAALGELGAIWPREQGHAVALYRRDGQILARHPRAEGPAAADRELAAAIARAPLSGTYWAHRQPDGVARLVAYRKLGDWPAWVAFGLPRDLILKDWWTNVALYGAVAFPASLLLLWTAWIALERARQGAFAVHRLEAEMKRRAEAESALLQRRKMEAVGQLTGGIAHDFNNLLTVVCANLELLRTTRLDDRQTRMTGAALRAVERAESLAQQLLSFSRRQPVDPQDFYLQDRIEGVVELLERSLPGNVALAVDVAPGIWPVRADPAQLELAILNCAVNARDAMPGGGRIAVTTRNLRLPGDGARSLALEGEFVALGVADTGCGMPQEVKDRVFEPFFTTKAAGKGTGLGLSQVYGCATQSGGTVAIDSAPGEGTTVTLYLPRAPAARPPQEPRRIDGVLREGEFPRRASMSSAKATTDHATIRKWAEKHGGKPAHVKTTAEKGGIGILRIDFPAPPDPDDAADRNLEAISWDEWFEKFEAEKLAFLHQESSNFNKLVSRENVEADAGGAGKKR